MDRRIVAVERGILRIEQSLRIAKAAIGTDAAGPACIFAQVQVSAGAVSYIHGDRRIATSSRFALFLPPFALVQAHLENCEVSTAAVAFLPSGRDLFPARALLLPAFSCDLPSSEDEMSRLLEHAHPGVHVDRAVAPHALAASAKGIFDAEYQCTAAISDVAKRLDCAPSVLSRSFRQAFGIAPVRYRHHVRIMDALMRFAQGEFPAEVSLDVGFGDLSRFYKMFQKVACGPPGSYRPLRSRNAKT